MRFITKPIKLIVGLGNPGRGYANNRHNLGFMCLNDFAKRHGLQFDKKQGQARAASGEVAGHKVILARPQTYMNQSGQAVSPLVRKFNITLEDLIVVHDDLDLPVGKIRIRQGGGSAGHKGVQSIIAELGSPDFARIRVGIGQADDTSRPGETDVIGYVLSGFSAEERPVISRVIATVGEAILCYLTEGLAVAMNKYN